MQSLITKISADDQIIKFLEAEKHINLNMRNYLSYDQNAEVYLYDGDIKNGVIAGNAGQDFFFASTECLNFIDEFWALLPGGHKVFSGVPAPTARVFEQRHNFVWQSYCNVYVFTGEFEEFENPEYKAEALTLEDAEEVNHYYTYKSEVSLKYICENILTMDSSCIRVNGELAAWCMVHAEDGSMGPLYTKEEFRRLGLAKIITSRMINKLLAKEIIPYVQIVSSNAASLNLIKGFEAMRYSHDCSWFGIDKGNL